VFLPDPRTGEHPPSGVAFSIANLKSPSDVRSRGIPDLSRRRNARFGISSPPALTLPTFCPPFANCTVIFTSHLSRLVERASKRLVSRPVGSIALESGFGRAFQLLHFTRAVLGSRNHDDLLKFTWLINRLMLFYYKRKTLYHG